NRDITALLRALVRGLHNTRPTASDDAKASFGQQFRRLRRCLVGWIVGLHSRRAEDGDRGRNMGKRVKALDEFAHDTKDTPGIGEREVKVNGAINGMLNLFHLLLR